MISNELKQKVISVLETLKRPGHEGYDDAAWKKWKESDEPFPKSEARFRALVAGISATSAPAEAEAKIVEALGKSLTRREMEALGEDAPLYISQTIKQYNKLAAESDGVAKPIMESLGLSEAEIAGKTPQQIADLAAEKIKTLSPAVGQPMTAVLTAANELKKKQWEAFAAEAVARGQIAQGQAQSMVLRDVFKRHHIGNGAGEKSFAVAAKDGTLDEIMNDPELAATQDKTVVEILGGLVDTKKKFLTLDAEVAVIKANAISAQQDAIKKTAEAAATSRPLEDIAADIKAGRKVSAAERTALQNYEKLLIDTDVSKENAINLKYQNKFNQIGLNMLTGNGGGIDMRGAMQRSWNGNPGAGIDMGELMQGSLNGGSPDAARAAMKSEFAAATPPAASNRRVVAARPARLGEPPTSDG